MNCPHNDEYECFDCETARHDAEHPVEVDGCPTCKYRTIRLSNTCHPTRTPSPTAPAGPDNSWERGVATDHRGVPYLKRDLNPIGVKEFAAKRSVYEEAIRRNRQGAVQPT